MKDLNKIPFFIMGVIAVAIIIIGANEWRLHNKYKKPVIEYQVGRYAPVVKQWGVAGELHSEVYYMDTTNGSIRRAN